VKQLPEYIGFDEFAVRAVRPRKADPQRVARAGLTLVDGALRIRRGGDGLYGAVERPVTKPAEAVRAWLKGISQDIGEDGSFTRAAEMREALIAAAEEVDAAVKATPAAERLRGALYSDALDVLGSAGPSGWRPYLPWFVAAGLGGALIGVLIAKRKW
jgi:hypothetical protein